MSVVVSVSERAYTWIKDRGSHVVVSMYQGNPSCCTGGVSEIQFFCKIPAHPKHYRIIQHEGLTVYLAPQITLKENRLSIDLKGIGWFQNLVASGVKRF
ncbi:CC/Se motif family (seleno)protein [Halalkalibacterium ligniniphilum]|uniref:CC/Se motif family (seleno)protein n=1 Tax=Halalkalibacterium ligniniphilum TaxID=1134413 RepID=UPI000347A8C2|nr:CC/Se motif family (seleno)protein [Halalkalibacterium ligniniphilum]